MNALQRVIFTLLAVILLTGCGLRAMDAQRVFLEPVLTVASSGQGNDTLVALTVVDERSATIIGYRGWAYGDAAEITTSQDVTQVIGSKVREGLVRQGFKPLISGEAVAATLRVEVRLIEYNVSQGWDFILHARSTLKAIAGKEGRILERFYRIENEKRVMIVPPDETNAEIINKSVSEAINSLISDGDLLTFLAN